jgi:manganese/zinc/iron transport system permease protein
VIRAFLEFWSLKDPNVGWVLLGSILLGASAGIIGCFAFLRKRSLTGDALAHAALPGVTTAFLLAGSKDPLVILSGAMASCFLGYLSIEFLVHKTKIKEDSAFAIVLSLFFALGIFQLTYIQKLGIGSQAGLDKLLFGQAASLVRADVQRLGGIAAALLLFVALFFRKLKILTFDREFAQALGLRVRTYEAFLALAVVISVVIGLQLVGVVLMAAIMLTPAASARYWTEELWVMVCLAGTFGALSGIFGANVSYLAPRMPTGPWMVLGSTLLFAASVLFAPQRGFLARVMKRRRLKLRTNEENLLRTLYKIGETSKSAQGPVDRAAIFTFRNMNPLDFERTVAKLIQKGFVTEHADKLQLTEPGFAAAEKVTVRHRLWELYLTQRINVAPDHVHEDAEEIEHLLSPEMEQLLRSELGDQSVDPHGRAIPSVSKEKW